MWINQNGEVVPSGQYEAPDGTTYPGNFPRNEIPGLTEVSDPRPEIPAVDQIERDIVVMTQNRLDAFAQTRGYDGILSASTYATSAVDRFRAEGQYCVDARDATWNALYQLMTEVQAGNAPMPAGFSGVEPLLPVLSWPA